MNVLITGGAGFIGSHTTEQFLADGHTVTCIDSFDDYYPPSMKRKNISSYRSHDRFCLVQGDIRNHEVLRTAFSRAPVDAVVHFAAMAGVRPSLVRPELYYDINVLGTLRLLEVMRQYGVMKMLFASSSSVYGNRTNGPFSENDQTDAPISPYAATKKSGELLCHYYHHLYGFEIYCLRFFTVYGPRQRPDMAINRFLRSVSLGEPVVLYGDGSGRRDYTFIGDAVAGIRSALTSLRGFEIINIGGGTAVTLKQLIAAIEKAVGRKAEIQWQPKQPGDVEATLALTVKAKSLLNFDPRVSLDEGLAKFARWIKEESGLTTQSMI